MTVSHHSRNGVTSRWRCGGGEVGTSRMSPTTSSYPGVGQLVPDVGQVVASLISVHVGLHLSDVDALSYPSLELKVLSGDDFALLPIHNMVFTHHMVCYG